MRIELNRAGDCWLIVRGRGKREQVFCFLVDHDSSTWTNRERGWSGQKFATLEEAEEIMTELRRRARERKQSQLQRDIDRAKEAVIEAAKEWYRESDGNDAIVVDALTMAVERLFELEAVKL